MTTASILAASPSLSNTLLTMIWKHTEPKRCFGRRAKLPHLCHLTCPTNLVFAVDLLPGRVKMQIFVDMPWRIRLRTLAAPLHGKSPQVRFHCLLPGHASHFLLQPPHHICADTQLLLSPL